MITVRKATVEDAWGIAKVQVDSWRTTYKGVVPNEYLNSLSYESRFQKWKETISNQSVFVAENADSEIVGFANGGKQRFEKYAKFSGELYAIYLLQSYQQKGIGKQLVKMVVDDLLKSEITSMSVLVLADNSAKYFYEKLGAKLIGEDELEIAGVKLRELVYGWNNLNYITW